jgi:ELWxxDGT repeat protein
MLPNVVLFEGEDSSGHYQLWETNGTAVGTIELAGIAGTSATGLGPVDLAPYNADEVLFGGAGANGLYGLWETNGTAAGTHELTGIAGEATTGSGLYPSDLTSYNGEILFSGYDASGDIGLWVTDGTVAGTHEMAVAGALTTSQGLLLAGLNPSDLTVYNGYVFFAGDDASGGVGLWETDGTAAGTHELTGIVGAATKGQDLGPPGLYPSDLTVFNDQILFSGNDARSQTGLWETDGTAAGTHEVTGIAGAATTGVGLDPSDFTVYNGEVLFSGIDSSGLCGLWETNGTAAGTHELTGIAGEATTGLGLCPQNLTNFNGELLFIGRDSSGQYGLWKTNGTAAGTHELSNIAGAQTTGVGLDPVDFTVYDGEVLFSGYDSSGKLGLWETDGTAAGTHELTGIAGAAASGLSPYDLTAITPGPVLTAGASMNYVAAAAPVTLDAGLSVSDAEAASLTSATVSISAGFLPGDVLSVGSPQTGIASSYNSATGVLTLSGSASLAAYQTELASVAFAASSAANPSRTIAWSVNDGQTMSVSVTSSVSVSSDPPVLTAGASVSATAGAAPVTLDAGLSISDAEAASLTSATVSISGGFLPGDVLSVGSPQTGIASSYNSATGVLTLSGSASLAAYRSELASVALAASSAANRSRTITWSVNDGVAASVPVTSSVSVSTNPPVLTAGTSVNAVAGAAPVTVDPGLTVADAEAASLLSATVSISGGFLAGDMLSVGSPEAGVTSAYDAATGVLTLSGAASLAAYRTELDSIAFAASSAANLSRTITWSVNDGLTTSIPVSSSVSVSSVDPPATGTIPPPDLFNNVDKADILWQNTNGDVTLWNSNSGSESFTGEDLGVVGGGWQIAGTGAFNGASEAGVLWRNSNGDTALWNANGSGGFTFQDLGVVSTSWQVAGTGDFSGNGEDILWRNANGDTALWNANGSGGFTFQDLGVVPSSWQIAGTGDFTGNGEDSILWRNTNGDTELWNPNGSGGFVGEDLGVVPSSWQIAGTGDFSGTGEDSILWRNSNGDTELWNPNGSGGFIGDDLGVVPSSWQIAGTGDFSGDGKSGILWRNSSGDTELWNPNGSGGFVGEDLGVVPTSWSVHKIFA